MHPRRIVPQGDFLRSVETLNIGERTMPRFGSHGKVLAMRLFYLQRMPEAFHWRIVALNHLFY